MTKVNSILRLGANEHLLICDGEEPSTVSGVLTTNIGDFSPEEYTLGRCTQCFSQGNCFAIRLRSVAIRLRSEKNCMKIRSVDFR